MRRSAKLQLIVGAILPLLAAYLTGCSTAKAPRSQSSPEAVKLTSFWQPQLLYILPSPHSRLYVEVDAVEGCQPSDTNLHKLREFLTTYCNKPDGIEIVRGDVIPASTARGIPLRALARKFMNGPPDNNSGSPAYLYVLYCDPALCDKPALSDGEQRAVSTTSHHEPAVRKPHVDFLPYPPVMYINPSYGPKSVQNELLIHEAGHELGLAGRSTNAFAYHCLDKKCLMNWTIRYHIARSLLGMDPINQRHLCPLCIAQLSESAKQSPPANLRFVGPVLVRSETDFYVLSLPDRVKVIVGNLTEQDCRDFAAAVRAEKIPSNDDGARVDWFVKDEVVDRFAKVSDYFDQAKVDPLELVRTTAPRIFAQFCATQGHVTNAINICRETIQSNPNDDWSYNLLAWIEATSPDSSLRDGKEAVSLATKACELTRWSQWNWIDTLAAAYAESADFRRAIQYQEQALRTGSPPESEEKTMRERLALYEQSQPYREKP
jgi:hypothetical protein